DDNGVADDDGGRTAADGRQWIGVESAAGKITLEIHHAARPEAGHWLAGSCIQRHQVEAGRHDDNARITLTVLPVGNPAARVATRRAHRTFAFFETPAPALFASGRVQRHDGAIESGRS